MQAFHFQFQPFNTNFEELFRRLNVIGNTKKKKPEFLSVFRLIDWESFGNSVIVFCLSIRLSVCVSDFLWSFFVRLSVSVSLFLSVFVSDCFSQSFYLPLCLAFSLFLSFCMLVDSFSFYYFSQDPSRQFFWNFGKWGLYNWNISISIHFWSSSTNNVWSQYYMYSKKNSLSLNFITIWTQHVRFLVLKICTQDSFQNIFWLLMFLRFIKLMWVSIQKSFT